MSFFRYPGGKTKLKRQIILRLKQLMDISGTQYREPFFGGGSIGLSLLEEEPRLNRIWINDIDKGIADLWSSIIREPEELKNMVRSFKPSVRMFDQYKKELSEPIIYGCRIGLDNGFKKLAIHQMSYSGLGVMSGGPLGGRDQKSEYKIDCRWSPEYICKKIDALHKRFSKLSIMYHRCTHYDFGDVLNDDEPSLVYLDPPYYVKGNELYQFGFTHNDHVRLMEILKKTKHVWLLSYDDCPEIRRLYNWANIEVVDGVNYSITALKDKDTQKRMSRQKNELLIIK